MPSMLIGRRSRIGRRRPSRLLSKPDSYGPDTMLVTHTAPPGQTILGRMDAVVSTFDGIPEDGVVVVVFSTLHSKTGGDTRFVEDER